MTNLRFINFLLILIAITGIAPSVSTVFGQEFHFGGNTQVQYRDSERHETIEVTLDKLNLSGIRVQNQNYAFPSIDNASYLTNKGEPALPFLPFDLLLGDSDQVELKLLSLTKREIALTPLGYAGVIPSKGHFNRNIDPNDVPWLFEPKIYEEGTIYPDRHVFQGTPYIAGPLRGQNFHIPVVKWNIEENTLIVVERATFEIVRKEDRVNPRANGKEKRLTGLFSEMMNRKYLNTLRTPPEYDTLVESGRVLFLVYDEFIEEVQPLIDWEEQVGYPVSTTLLSEVPHAGTSPAENEIFDYVQAEYNSPEGLTWLILVGDYQEIGNLPGQFESAPCDACYTKLEGNDHHPDIAISRISAQTELDVTVQVDKFLNYEQNPDSGSSADWYSRAFGVAGDDTGGTPSYTDWQRMNFLRDILLTPSFHFNEFTEIYHASASAAQVTTAVEAGHSLGLYIGHGSETSWATTGFNVDNASALTNANMLPIVWDVACVNGAFQRPSGDCFAEAWVKNEGGGAVSFEAATTNESWVPPCDAQRGILDAFRNGWAFTTGGQHLYGKETCFGINGDTSSSEGNKFMEQSTLFGNCLMWPRTQEPQTPDEPLDFMSTGTTASLTVQINGTPLSLANSAIVNFYTKNGSDHVYCGSGLIDENGFVQAPIDGEPTHCHIHGFNLVPVEYELAARPSGTVSFSASVTSCSSLVHIRVSDSNISGTSPTSIDQIQVNVIHGTTVVPIVLTETQADSNIFSGELNLAQDLSGSHGDIVSVEYIDEDDGAGNLNQLRTAEMTLDCLGPVISDVVLTASENAITVAFTTDEKSSTLVNYGEATPPAFSVADIRKISGSHSVLIEGIDSCKRYYVELVCTDEYGNESTDNNSGLYYSVDSLGFEQTVIESFDADPSWQIDNGNASNGWEFGTPTGGGGQHGSPDPTGGYTGDHVYGVNLTGDYLNNLGADELKLTSAEIAIPDFSTLKFSFRRWLGVESPSYDHARLKISFDSGPFETLWENSQAIADSDWVLVTYDLTNLAQGHSSFQLRWTQGATDGSYTYCGWNIDDLHLQRSYECEVEAPDPIFKADFENGDCSEWSQMVSNQ
ncbi:MAG: hypothetical protein CR997_06390 [Acidobacteria bacterium]|nr:MAG: hypothetical protein CR997_06390 [Acidobacteriota bacterium]